MPHDLTEAQAQRHMEICQDLLQIPRDDRFNRLNKQNQWLHAGQVAELVVKREVLQEGNAMYFVEF